MEPPTTMLPLVDKSTAETADVPLPNKTPSAVKDVAPVPPLATVTVSDRVDPAAVTVIAAEPSKFTPLMALGVVRVAALPVVS